jgi:acetyl-CoA synthetase
MPDSSPTGFFPPPAPFRQAAQLRDPAVFETMYRESIGHPDSFFGQQAQQLLPWMKPFRSVLDWTPPFARWFSDGETNAALTCLDWQIEKGHGNKAALIWEGEEGDQRVLTYRSLKARTCQLANALEKLGVKEGDRVAIYLPMIPEAAIAMLACARIGAPHTVVFAGFSSEALKDRLNDAEAKVIMTADGAHRRGRVLPLKAAVDAALAMDACPSVQNVIVVNRTGLPVAMHEPRDRWWNEVMHGASTEHRAKSLPSEHPLFILYTSGSTGKPKGVLHSTAGYLLGAVMSCRYVLDLKDDDVFWCTADIGWITGHSFVVYGPLAVGATILMYEGALDYPDPARPWALIERHEVSVFYTAPTAIRSFMRAGDHHANQHNLRSLRLLGTVGEPINPEAWRWYHEVIGKGACPIVDTWWQTETGSIMIAPVPGLTPTKPGSATRPFFGVDAEVVREDGTPCEANEPGLLVIRKPWPSMLRTLYRDDARYQATYWSKIPGVYFAGDNARRDEDGYFWILGRADDVLNVAGHRLGTAEIESALVAHPNVAEAAVVGKDDDLKGQSIVAFVTLKANAKDPQNTLPERLRTHVAEMIGAIARPSGVFVVSALPKTRSGKIMRRLLRNLANGVSPEGDTSTLEDHGVLDALKKAVNLRD